MEKKERAKLLCNLDIVFDLYNGNVTGYTHDSLHSLIMSKTGIDIYLDSGYKDRPSRGKKLRYFIETESREYILDVIKELVIYAEKHKNTCLYIYDPEQDSRILDFQKENALKELNSFINKSKSPSSIDERLNHSIQLLERACSKIEEALMDIAEKKYINYSNEEDVITDEMITRLKSADYILFDQHRQGTSSTGKKSGELDLKMEENNSHDVVIVEALKLNALNTSSQVSIDDHTKRALINYNPNGNPCIILFYLGKYNKNESFLSLWGNILDYYSDRNSIPLEVTKDIIEGNVQCSPVIKKASFNVEKNNYEFPVAIIATDLDCLELNI